MSNPKAKTNRGGTAHVISHTHWDREWYLTVEQYRFRLVRMLDRVIELLQHDDAWNSFFLDGQTQALVDYLEVRPEQEPEVRKLIRKDKLRLGPWCVQPDEQLISGEATIRNLLSGRDDCRRFGGGEPVGYLADNFGHSTQMPQILRGFGLDNAAFWRGYDENHIPGAEVRWEGADGSTVLAIMLVRGYSNAAGFGPQETDDKRLLRNLPVVQRLSRTGHLPVTEGIDHSLPPANLREVLAEIARQFPDLKVCHTGWRELLAEIRPHWDSLPVLQGELMWCPGLASTLSNRLGQKQANQRCETLLASCAEPLASLALLAGARYPDGFLRRAWHLMVKNAAHDSIGGAHTDPVARDVKQRFARVAEIGRGVVNDALDALVGLEGEGQEPAAQGRVAVFNPAGSTLNGVVEISLDLPDPHGRDWRFHSFAGIALYDGADRVPIHVVDDQPTIHPVYQERIIPKIRNTRTLRLLAEVTGLPPLGVKTLAYMPGNQAPQVNILQAEERAKETVCVEPPLLSPQPGVLRNEQVEVRVHPDGSFDLTLLATGRCWTGLNALVDEQDNGNQYEFAFPKNRAAATPAPGRILTALNSPLRSVVRVETTLDLFDERPDNPDLLQRRMGNDAPAVACALTVEIGLDKGSARVDVSVKLDNRGAGHRLRARFGPVGDGHRLRVSTPFDLVDRTPALNAERPRGITQAQMDALNAQGMQGFLVVNDASGGFALAGRGLYEYQHYRQAEAIGLTLLRSVGTINFGFERWGSSEDGYLPGRQQMDYAFCPFSGDLHGGGTLARVDAFLAPVACRQYPQGEGFTVAGPALPDARLRFSALKQAEERPALIFRFFNSSEETVSASIPLGRRYAEIWQCRPDETRERRVGKAVETVTLEVAPKKIVTLELVPAVSGGIGKQTKKGTG